MESWLTPGITVQVGLLCHGEIPVNEVARSLHFLSQRLGTFGLAAGAAGKASPAEPGSVGPTRTLMPAAWHSWPTCWKPLAISSAARRSIQPRAVSRDENRDCRLGSIEPLSKRRTRKERRYDWTTSRMVRGAGPLVACWNSRTSLKPLTLTIRTQLVSDTSPVWMLRQPAKVAQTSSLLNVSLARNGVGESCLAQVRFQLAQVRARATNSTTRITAWGSRLS